MARQTYDILAEREDMIHRCYRCGLCRTVCPSFQELGAEGASPRGRVQFARCLLEGSVGLDAVVKSRMLDCLNCMRCGEICPADVKTHEIVIAARAELALRGDLNVIKKLMFRTVLRSPRLMSLFSRAGSLGKSVFFDSVELVRTLGTRLVGYEDKKLPTPSKRQTLVSWPEVVRPEGTPVMRVGYFVGCATNLIFPEVADATIRVLVKNGVEVVIPKGQSCCGIPVYTSGDLKTARKLAERNNAIFDGLDVDCIITDCASCSAALKHEIEELVGVRASTKKVYDLNEFLISKIDIIRDFRDVGLRVTYHDPCHLKRGQGIWREPRELIAMVPGVELVEMKDADMCCGGAGTFAYTHHGLSRDVGARKAASVKATNADCVVTPCPSCTMQLDDILNHDGLSVPVVHPVQILDYAYGNTQNILKELICRCSAESVSAGIADGDVL